MKTSQYQKTVSEISPRHIHPRVHQVPALRPIRWLEQGWNDMLSHPIASLAYGAIVSLLGTIILGYYAMHPLAIVVSAIGFMLVGPIMAAGVAELSRQHDLVASGLPGDPDFDHSLRTLKAHKTPLLKFGTLLMLISAIWFAISAYVLQQVFGSAGPSLTENLWDNMLYSLSTAQLVAYLGIAALLSIVVFVMSVVTVPMIIDQDCDASSAISTSVMASLNADRIALLVWGLLCSVLVAIGFATYLIGMIVIFPLLGHATWYAYRDLVESNDD